MQKDFNFLNYIICIDDQLRRMQEDYSCLFKENQNMKDILSEVNRIARDTVYHDRIIFIDNMREICDLTCDYRKD